MGYGLLAWHYKNGKGVLKAIYDILRLIKGELIKNQSINNLYSALCRKGASFPQQHIEHCRRITFIPAL